MNKHDEDHLTPDEFEPIELGSVSEETRGSAEGDTELYVTFNSRIP